MNYNNNQQPPQQQQQARSNNMRPMNNNNVAQQRTRQPNNNNNMNMNTSIQSINLLEAAAAGSAAGGSSSSFSMINAPTSLTNLAQLSGITLLPIGDCASYADGETNPNTIINAKQRTTAPTNCNLPQMMNVVHHINNNIQSPPSSSSSSSSLNQRISLQNTKRTINTTTTSQQSSYINTVGSRQSIPTSRIVKTNPNEQPRVFNISSIPSVQSLNQTSNDLIFRRNIIVDEPRRSQFNNHTQSMTSANLSHQQRGEPSDRLQQPRAQLTATNKIIHNLNQTNGGVQVISVPNNNNLTSSLQYLSRPQHQQQAERKSAMMNMDATMTGLSDSLVPENNYCNVNGDANNISLIKLMAILNNPALTITAVGPREQPTNPIIDYDTTESHNIFESFGDRLPKDSRQKSNKKTANSSNTSRNFSSNISGSRLPQSAANLQMIHGSSQLNHYDQQQQQQQQQQQHQQQREPNGMAELISVNNSHLNTRALQIFDRQTNDDSEIDCLSDCNQDNGDTTDIHVQYPIDHCETQHNISVTADPTQISTSVRNLLMQQISNQGTNKQQNKSAQLLRHIANQEQDNDDSRSQDQDQSLPIAESIFIPSRHREVKQIFEDVKMIENERRVWTTDLSKRKPKGPTKTSRHRLYVPGMDNGNLRHSRTNESRYYLNDIHIIPLLGVEVHLSERHGMLDAMMNLEEKKKRKYNLTEPDEIFINRSKRIMSKIDTMLERKKRRRFERISGREQPKTNSIEDQCAESEQEWSSDDEAMDLDSVGIIKTQLPLEEIETQEKKDHFMSVGLVSRKTKHNIEAELCEKKLNLITPLALDNLNEPDEDIRRFVDTILKTNGEDVPLRVDSNIKRNDLPLVEGLNRNTSRLKMSYMNLLGLEKRSKRTTLYKVKQIENISSANFGKQTDLIKTPKELTSDEPRPKLDSQRQQLSTNTSYPARSVPQPPSLRLAPTNCRNIFKLPNKNDYMKSLGLMAS